MKFLIEPSYKKRKHHYTYEYRTDKLNAGAKQIYKKASHAASVCGIYRGRKIDTWKVYKRTPSNKVLEYKEACKIQKTMPPKILKVA